MKEIIKRIILKYLSLILINLFNLSSNLKNLLNKRHIFIKKMIIFNLCKNSSQKLLKRKLLHKLKSNNHSHKRNKKKIKFR